MMFHNFAIDTGIDFYGCSVVLFWEFGPFQHGSMIEPAAKKRANLYFAQIDPFLDFAIIGLILRDRKSSDF